MRTLLAFVIAFVLTTASGVASGPHVATASSTGAAGAPDQPGVPARLALLAPAHALVPIPKSVTRIDGPGFRPGPVVTWRLAEAIPLAGEHMAVFAAAIHQLDGRSLQPAADVENAADAAADPAAIPAADPGAIAPAILIQRSDAVDPEGYELEVGRAITIRVHGLHGLAAATATLLQLWSDVLPAQRIVDAPASRYRSLMVDVGRNPHSIGLLRQTIDLLWYYKLGSLHLHLTDDQRWAFPSAAFPNLASEPAAIDASAWLALDRYAAVRGVEIIPELDVPGHSTILRREYPEVFGATPTELAERPAARAALKTLIDEMIELFPSARWIHVGADEAYGVPQDLQRDLLNELHAHVTARGRKTIAWEGPGLGTGANKVNEDVVLINWRTVDFPPDEMVRAGYRIVNAAWDPLYIVDHYPRNNFTMAAPQRLYERMDRRRFAHFRPDVRTFGAPIKLDDDQRVLGWCMPWWEGREENFLHLVVPRMIPMAEIAWSEPAPAARDYAAFEDRAMATEARRRAAFHPVDIQPQDLVLPAAGVFHRQTTVHLIPRGHAPAGAIHYTLDGTEPTPASPRATEPFVLDRSATVRAAVFHQGRMVGHDSRRRLTRVDPVANLALGRPVRANVPSGPHFSAGRLTDGGTGNLDQFLAFPARPSPVEVTIDLGAVHRVGAVAVHTYTSGRSWESYGISVSDDGAAFTVVAERWAPPPDMAEGAAVRHAIDPVDARYVRITSRGHIGQVFDSFSRMTEVQVFGPAP
ncbi:MAG: family 20 glycosylhydrolase [Phycisphaerales bacterium]